MRATRSDRVRNRAAVIDAAETLLRRSSRDGGQPVSIATVADAAGLAPATVYRHFASLDAVLRECVLGAARELERFTESRRTKGAALLEDVTLEWFRLIDVYGSVLVRIRSEHGFIQRLREGDELVTVLTKVWGPPIRQIMEQCDAPPDAFEQILVIHNAMFDAREIMDLRAATQQSEVELVARMCRMFSHVIRAWNDV